MESAVGLCQGTAFNAIFLYSGDVLGASRGCLCGYVPQPPIFRTLLVLLHPMLSSSLWWRSAALRLPAVLHHFNAPAASACPIQVLVIASGPDSYGAEVLRCYCPLLPRAMIALCLSRWSPWQTLAGAGIAAVECCDHTLCCHDEDNHESHLQCSK